MPPVQLVGEDDQSRLVTGDEDEVVAFGGQAPGEPRTDAGGATRDQRGADQIVGHISPPADTGTTSRATVAARSAARAGGSTDSTPAGRAGSTRPGRPGSPRHSP